MATTVLGHNFFAVHSRTSIEWMTRPCTMLKCRALVRRWCVLCSSAGFRAENRSAHLHLEKDAGGVRSRSCFYRVGCVTRLPKSKCEGRPGFSQLSRCRRGSPLMPEFASPHRAVEILLGLAWIAWVLVTLCFAKIREARESSRDFQRRLRLPFQISGKPFFMIVNEDPGRPGDSGGSLCLDRERQWARAPLGLLWRRPCMLQLQVTASHES